MGTGASTMSAEAGVLEVATTGPAANTRGKRSSKEALMDDPPPRPGPSRRRSLPRRLSREDCVSYSKQESSAISAQLFAAMDTHQDGRLTVDELTAVCLEYFATLATAQPERWVRVMIQKYDADEDGEVRDYAHTSQYSEMRDIPEHSPLRFACISHFLRPALEFSRATANRRRIRRGRRQFAAVLSVAADGDR